MNKLVINHLGRMFVTSDASTLLRELEVEHPAAKMLVMAAEMQHQEVGDMVNFVVTFAGELLSHAESLLRLVRFHGACQPVLGGFLAASPACTVFFPFSVSHFKSRCTVSAAACTSSVCLHLL